MQAAKGGTQWRGLWRALTHGPVLSPSVVWTRSCLFELRDWLWEEEAGLDRRRRQAKRNAQARRDAGRETGVASAVVGAAALAGGAAGSRPTSRQPKKSVPDAPRTVGVDVGRAWYGYEDSADQSHLVPDTRVAAGAPPTVPWDHETCQVTYATLDNMLCIDGLYISHLLPALLSAGLKSAASDVETTEAPPRIPPSFPRRTLAALTVEANPRRRFALLQTLRVLASCVLSDPCGPGEIIGRESFGVADVRSQLFALALSRLADVVTVDSAAIPRVMGIAASAASPAMEAAAFDDADGLVDWCLATAARCTVGIADAGPSFGAVAGVDGGYTAVMAADAPVPAAVFGHTVRARVAVAAPGQSDAGAFSGRGLPPSVLWPPAGEAAGLAGGGEHPYWLALLRQECVLLLRLLLNRRSAAVRLSRSREGFTALLQLLQLSAEAPEEAPAPRSRQPAAQPPDDDAAPASPAYAPLASTTVDDGGVSEVLQAYSRACKMLSAPSPSFAGGLLTSTDVLAVSTACWDVGLTGRAQTGGRTSQVSPFPSSVGGSTAPAALWQESIITDPDVTLVLNHRLLKRSTLGRAAAEALLAATKAWAPACRVFAREDAMQALVLPLLLAPRHPRVVGIALQLLRVVLPQIPLYVASLTRHALTQAVLLTALPPPLGAVLEGEASDTNDEAYAYLGLTPGLCADAAALLHETHLAEYDDVANGWVEIASAPPRAAARLLVDAPDTGVPASTSTAVGLERTNATAFRWTAQTAKATFQASTSSSALAPFLPPALIRVLQDSGPEAFARIFNAKQYSAPTCIWSSSMRQRLLGSLEGQVERLCAWVGRGEADAASLALHPCATIDSHTRALAAAGGLKSIAQMHGLSQPFSAIATCSASVLLCVPPVLHTPAPAAVAYPELDSEPRVGGVYLRVYVEGQDLPQKDAATFMPALVASLHREVAALLAAHCATARQISLCCLDTAGRDALAAYECAHSRTLLTLRALRRMLAESPGAKLEADAYTAIASLFASTLGFYPNIAANGVLPPPPNTGGVDDVAPTVRISASAIFQANCLQQLPLSLEVSNSSPRYYWLPHSRVIFFDAVVAAIHVRWIL